MFPAEITEQPLTYLQQTGEIFARFGPDTQDSGNISYGVQLGADRYFFKTAGIPTDTEPYLDFAGRQELLRNAARLAESVVHPLLPTFHGVIESPAGPVLVYEWREGEHLRAQDPFERFRALPIDELVSALDQLFDLHADLAKAGWVTGDFYDGALIYNFSEGNRGERIERQLTVMDLDSYRLGPYRNDMGRMFGSSRFMAPEEFSLGAPIDDRTTAFVMARTALVFLSDGTLDRAACRATDPQYAVLQEATTTRYPTYSAFHEAWRAAS
jgi:serine/threonine-protein kinase